jgi:hypothetical protein
MSSHPTNDTESFITGNDGAPHLPCGADAKRPKAGRWNSSEYTHGERISARRMRKMVRRENRSDELRPALTVGLLFNGHEPLHALAAEDFPRVDVALGVDRNHMQPVELACIFAHAAQLAHDLAIFAIQEPDVVVR